MKTYPEISTLLELLKSASNYQNKIEIKNEWYKKYIISLKHIIVKLPIEDKKILGQRIKKIEQNAQQIMDDEYLMWQKHLYQEIDQDYSLLNEEYQQLNPHPLNELLNSIFNWAKGLNFQIESGNEIVNIYENFSMLNVPEDHPARNTSDTFYYHEKKLLLRTHTTAHTARVLAKIAPLFHNQTLTNYRLLSYGHVYRNDLDDSTHSHQFNQVDLLWVGIDLNVRHLKWLIKNLIEYIFQTKLTLRFRSSFFPFTSPSFEVDFKCIFCQKNSNCSLCQNSGWIEVLGCGLLHSNVWKEASFNQTIVNNTEQKYTGLAVGLGLERFVMLRQNIKDIRQLYQNDYRWLLKRKPYAY